MSDDQRTAIAAMFDQTAATYDRVGVEMFQPIARRLVAELDPQPGEQALDIGCGRGAALFPLADAVGAGGHVTAIDLSPAMVELTAAEAAAAGVDADIRVGDAQEPDLPPGSFDLAASSLVVFFLPDPPAAVGAWRALLRPGGRLGISTFGPYGESWEQVDAVFAPYLPPDMRDARTRRQGSPFESDATVEALLRDAGFADVRTVTETLPVRFADEDQWHEWTWSVGQRRMWQLVPEADRDDVRREAYRRLQATRDGDGRIGFDQVVRYTLGHA